MRYPVVSYAGDYAVFSKIQSSLISELPKGDVEWKRPYGRKTRSVNVEVDFVQFSEEKLAASQVPRILDHPIFHTFWTDCPDIDTYKTSVKERLQSWVQTLKQHNISDWMIVIIETLDSKKSNKLLPRTTVLDKLKNDFGGKQSERCISLVDPSKNDSRASESWHVMMVKLRQLIMIAYNRALQRFEEQMRSERERRIRKNWSFCEYFLLQEELAEVFNLLSLQEEALVQYDELDALFTQFVLNSAAGDTPRWLCNFSRLCENWEGFYLNNFQHSPMQDKIREKNINLLEFRNYLFQKQCQILVHMKKPWELASRALTFLQNTVSELRLLGVVVYDGGVACWGFLSCLEVIHLLYKYKDAANTDSHAVHTAPLWSYARDKLKELGILCGLMPGGETTSAQLHVVVNLVAGMGEDPHIDDPVVDYSDDQNKTGTSPMARLKDALSSKESFTKHFLDISELAISTYKHIGRIRSARHIGKDLAKFYMASGSPQNAIPFLIDQLKTFLEEYWPHLIYDTHVHLAKCYLATEDTERYTKTCILLAASEMPGADESRNQYFKDAMTAAKKISEDKTVCISTDKIMEIGWFKMISKQPIIIGSTVSVEVVIENNLPESLRIDSLEIELRHVQHRLERSPNVKPKRSEVERRGSNSSSGSHGSRKLSVPSGPVRSASDMSDLSPHIKNANRKEEDEDDNPKEKNLYKKSLQMKFKIDRQQDDSIASASVSCLNPHKILRRRDSHGGLESYEKAITKETFVDFLYLKDFELLPGRNVMQASTKITKKGSFSCGQVSLSCGQMQFLCGRVSLRKANLQFDVTHENPQIYLSRKDTELMAGTPQILLLTVNSGSCLIEKGTKVTLKSQKGLQFRHVSEDQDNASLSVEGFSHELLVELPQIEAFEKAIVEINSFADLRTQKDHFMTEHMVTISSEILPENSTNVDVHFVLPFSATFKLHTAHLKKFIQVTINGQVPRKFYLTKPHLQINDSASSQVMLLNDPEQILVVSKGYDINYLWELSVDSDSAEMPPLRANFSVNYSCSENQTASEYLTFKFAFDVNNYKSLYLLRTRVDPMKGTEFCRAGNISHLNINLEQVQNKNTETKQASVMYEVIADQHMWAVCGQSSGVLAMDTSTKQNVMTEVMPLISGFLPLPTVRLSKYITADTKHPCKDSRRLDGSASHNRRLEPFAPGEIYNFSRAAQVHVLPAVHSIMSELGVG